MTMTMTMTTATPATRPRQAARTATPLPRESPPTRPFVSTTYLQTYLQTHLQTYVQLHLHTYRQTYLQTDVWGESRGGGVWRFSPPARVVWRGSPSSSSSSCHRHRLHRIIFSMDFFFKISGKGRRTTKHIARVLCCKKKHDKTCFRQQSVCPCVVPCPWLSCRIVQGSIFFKLDYL